jgi:hypothetical protein
MEVSWGAFYVAGLRDQNNGMSKVIFADKRFVGTRSRRKERKPMRGEDTEATRLFIHYTASFC